MRADVELHLPVDSAYVSVLRATTVSLAARLDFTLDEIEDLRVAVGEASAMVLRGGPVDHGELTCRYFIGPGELTVEVSVPSTAAQPPADPDWAWQVLRALTSKAESRTDEDSFTVALTVASTVSA